jgi:hypothetical protein
MNDKRSIREQNLHTILLSKYIPAEELNHSFSTWELQGTFNEKVFLETYESLGGRADFPELKFDVPFMEFGRFCILLDEHIHFNRYRAKALRSPFYENLSSFPLMKYRSYSRKYEVECLKAGTSKPAWTNDEAERHFGPSQDNGDLGLAGSSGWKLTAFKDFAIDLIARQRKMRLLRISVWDDLLIHNKLMKFNDLLMSPGNTETELILKYVERKVLGLYADDF